jgi:hypothetical protein
MLPVAQQTQKINCAPANFREAGETSRATNATLNSEEWQIDFA